MGTRGPHPHGVPKILWHRCRTNSHCQIGKYAEYYHTTFFNRTMLGKQESATKNPKPAVNLEVGTRSKFLDVVIVEIMVTWPNFSSGTAAGLLSKHAPNNFWSRDHNFNDYHVKKLRARSKLTAGFGFLVADSCLPSIALLKKVVW